MNTITKYERAAKIDAPVAKVFNFCTSSYGFEKHFPYKIRWINKQEKWDLGSVIEFEFCFFKNWRYWKTEITAYEKNIFFADIMKVGFPFKEFNHYHYFTPQNQNTIYTDKIEFSLGFGSFIDNTLGKFIVNSIFTKRHQNLKKYFVNYQKIPSTN